MAFWLFIFSIPFLVIWLNKQRAQKKINLPLIPNCLLTRYPIVFVSGKKTLFYFLNYWNGIPQYLANHGYEVDTLELPWRNSDARCQAFQSYLDRLEKSGKRVHLIIDLSDNELRKYLEEQSLNSIASISIVTPPPEKDKKLSIEDLKPRNSYIQDLEIPRQPLNRDLPSHTQKLLWSIHHSLLLRKPEQVETLGLPILKNPEDTMKTYLKHAIDLAERDLRMCH